MRRFAVALLGIALLVSACGGTAQDPGDTGIPVPDVVGEDEGYARGVLVGASLDVEIVTEETGDVPEGQVLRTEPAAGERVGPDTAVTLVIATSGTLPMIEVPDVMGEDEGYARGVLVGASLEVEILAEEHADVPEGQVLRTEPAAGQSVSLGSTVVLVVAFSPHYTVSGTFVLLDRGVGPDTACRGDGGYDDIRAGTQVRVKDGSGTVLATGDLVGGTRSGARCTFTLEILDVPKVDFYSVEVGRRGELSYSFEEMEENDWTVAFSLG